MAKAVFMAVVFLVHGCFVRSWRGTRRESRRRGCWTVILDGRGSGGKRALGAVTVSRIAGNRGGGNVLKAEILCTNPTFLGAGTPGDGRSRRLVIPRILGACHAADEGSHGGPGPDRPSVGCGNHGPVTTRRANFFAPSGEGKVYFTSLPVRVTVTPRVSGVHAPVRDSEVSTQ